MLRGESEEREYRESREQGFQKFLAMQRWQLGKGCAFKTLRQLLEKMLSMKLGISPSVEKILWTALEKVNNVILFYIGMLRTCLFLSDHKSKWDHKGGQCNKDKKGNKMHFFIHCFTGKKVILYLGSKFWKILAFYL